MILFLGCPSAKVIIQDIFGGNTEIIKHVDHSGAHWAGSAHVVFDVLGGFVVFQVGVVHHIMHETSGIRYASRIGGGVGTVQGEVEMKVGEVFLELAEVVEIEDLVQGAGTVEIVHLAVSDIHGAGQMHDLCAQRRHACATTYPYHFWKLRV